MFIIQQWYYVCMGRPRQVKTDAPVREKNSLVEDYNELKSVADEDSQGLKAKEIVFCRLIAEGGYTQNQAYIEAFQPSALVKDVSIIQMACRLARKPSVEHEINRIKTDIQEEAMSRQSKLMFALDGRKVAERMSIELYSIMTSASTDSKTKLRALELLGKMRHVDAFVSSTSINTQIVNGNLGIDTNAPVSEAKKNLLSNVTKLIESRREPENEK